MAQPKITFTKGKGGLGKLPDAEDYISGLHVCGVEITPKMYTSYLEYTQDYPNNFSDATAGTSNLTITAIGTTGEFIDITLTQFDGKTFKVSYQQTAGDTTIALLSASVVTKLNEDTKVHGYTATYSSPNIVISAPKNFGLDINGKNYSVNTINIATNKTPFAGAVGSLKSLVDYQVRKYFEFYSTTVLYLSGTTTCTSSFDEIDTLQNLASGKLRQIGLWEIGETLDTGNLQNFHTKIKSYDSVYKNCVGIYSCDMYTASVSTLPNLRYLELEKIAFCFGEDLTDLRLRKSVAKSIPAISTLLSCLSFGKVSDSIAYVSKFNIQKNSEFEKVGLANGTETKNLSESALDILLQKGYLYLKKFDIVGSYWVDSLTTTLATSDYKSLELNRVIDSAIRNSYRALIYELNSPLKVQADGTLTEVTISYFTSLIEGALSNMIRNDELSDFEVSIPAAQDVLSTDKLDIFIKLLPVGVARFIDVYVSYTTKI